MVDPIKADCRTTFHAVHSSGKRDATKVYWIVLHDEEAPTAASAARYFTDPKSEGSAHLCVDNTVCYRTLGDDEIPWGASSAFGANQHGFHIEQAGYARWSAVLWNAHWRTLQRAAFKTAYHCALFKVPPVFVSASGLVAGKHGVTTHAEVSKASVKMDPANAAKYSHSDPGPFWPRFAFMSLVRRYYAELVGV